MKVNQDALCPDNAAGLFNYVHDDRRAYSDTDYPCLGHAIRARNPKGFHKHSGFALLAISLYSTRF